MIVFSHKQILDEDEKIYVDSMTNYEDLIHR